MPDINPKKQPAESMTASIAPFSAQPQQIFPGEVFAQTADFDIGIRQLLPRYDKMLSAIGRCLPSFGRGLPSGARGMGSPAGNNTHSPSRQIWNH